MNGFGGKGTILLRLRIYFRHQIPENWLNIHRVARRVALGFYELRVWPILALELRDLRLNRADFRVLRCVAGCTSDHFLCSGI